MQTPNDTPPLQVLWIVKSAPDTDNGRTCVSAAIVPDVRCIAFATGTPRTLLSACFPLMVIARTGQVLSNEGDSMK